MIRIKDIAHIGFYSDYEKVFDHTSIDELVASHDLILTSPLANMSVAGGRLYIQDRIAIDTILENTEGKPILFDYEFFKNKQTKKVVLKWLIITTENTMHILRDSDMNLAECVLDAFLSYERMNGGAYILEIKQSKIWDWVQGDVISNQEDMEDAEMLPSTDAFNDGSNMLDRLINKTPTGSMRNKLSHINILYKTLLMRPDIKWIDPNELEPNEDKDIWYLVKGDKKMKKGQYFKSSKRFDVETPFDKTYHVRDVIAYQYVYTPEVPDKTEINDISDLIKYM